MAMGGGVSKTWRGRPAGLRVGWSSWSGQPASWLAMAWMVSGNGEGGAKEALLMWRARRAERVAWSCWVMRRR
jgi:hypothetical protein